MNVSAKRLLDCKILARDGEIGSMNDVLFEDRNWRTAYLVVHTGMWLFGRNVLISPRAAAEPDFREMLLPVSLTKEQIKNAPDLSVDLPLDRRSEAEYHDYFRWPYYWGGSSYAAMGWNVPVATEAMLVGDTTATTEEPKGTIPAQDRSDPDLRSAKEIFGFGVRSGGRHLGKLDDFLVDFGQEACAVPFALIELDDGKRVLVPTQSLKIRMPEDKAIDVGIEGDLLLSAPAFDETLIEGGRLEDLTRHFTTHR